MTPHNPLEGPAPSLSVGMSDGSDEQVSIIVVHRDRPAYLSMCLQSITATSLNANYELIVVDNASGQESQDFLTAVEARGVKVIRNRENKFWSPAANAGASAASPLSKYLIFMHSDVVVLNPAWIDTLIQAVDTQPAGIVGMELDMFEIAKQRIGYIREWLMITTRECWDDAGPFDERLPLIGAPFMYNMKARQKGYHPQLCKNQLAHHFGIFGVDISDWEVHTQQAKANVTTAVRELYNMQTT